MIGSVVGISGLSRYWYFARYLLVCDPYGFVLSNVGMFYDAKIIYEINYATKR